MPKRKRGAENDPAKLRRDEVYQKIAQCKQELNKALKTVKHTEMLKLGRREKQATASANENTLKRLKKEIAVLKTLDFAHAVDAHLYKTLLKSKRISESPLLPENVREIPRKPGGDEEQILAFNNVTARLYNAPAVRKIMSEIMTQMYFTLEIPEPNNFLKGKKAKVDVSNERDNGEPTLAEKRKKDEQVDGQDDAEDHSDNYSDVEPDWEGFGIGSEIEEDEDEEDEDGNSEDELGDDGEDVSLDEEQMSRYKGLIRNSSDESDLDDSHEERESSFPPISIPIKPSSKPDPPSVSRSPSPSSSKPKSILKATKAKPELEAPKGSVFLPTLMGGYWSGGDSDASDIESVADLQPRKNRRGQRERRKIAELKHGAKAKHLGAENTGKPSRNGRDDRDKDWDMKRGARLDGDEGPKNRKERRMAGAKPGRTGRDNRQMTGENAIPVADRKADGPPVKVVKDDGKKGVNHPSWQAAKKAKEATKMAAFQGTKVKFT